MNNLAIPNSTAMTFSPCTAQLRALLLFLALLFSAPLSRAGSQDFAGWDLFTCPDLTCAPNLPDLAGTTNTDATVEQQVAGAILTSSSNIYHPTAASLFVLRDAHTAALGQVHLFLREDGTPLDPTSVLLRFGSQTRLPTISGGPGQWSFDWDLDADSVFNYQIEWAASGAHMSLDRVELTTDTSDSLGTSFCTSTLNSSGAAATIQASGTPFLADNELFLTAQLIPNQPGIFFTGLNATQIPFGNGFLCTSGNILRGTVVHPTAQTVTYRWPTANLSVGTHYFQYWFRDPQSGGAFFNTSDGVALTLL